MSSSHSSRSPRPSCSTTTTTNGSAASFGSASSSHSSRSPRPSSAAASGQQQNQACAACKYQRRKCNPDCPLAPYFPADQQRRFLNAHRLFGVSNIQKTLRRIDPELGPEAMRTLIFEADARAADPVGGCVTIIERLQREVQRAELELAYVKQQVAIYRQTADPAASMMILPAATSGGAAAVAAGQDDNAVAMDALYAAGQAEHVPSGGTGLVFQHGQQGQGYHVVKVGDDQQQNQPQPQLFYNYFGYDGTAGDEATSSHEHDGTSVHGQYGFAENNNVRIGSPVALGEQLEQQCQIEAAPFVDAFDVKPHGMLATVGVGHQEEKLVGAVLKHDDVDQQMEEPAATGAAAPCHLELGFSSF